MCTLWVQEKKKRLTDEGRNRAEDSWAMLETYNDVGGH